MLDRDVLGHTFVETRNEGDVDAERVTTAQESEQDFIGCGRERDHDLLDPVF